MELDSPRYQIRDFRENVAILANSGDIPADFHVSEQLAELGTPLDGQAQGLGDLDFV